MFNKNQVRKIVCVHILSEFLGIFNWEMGGKYDVMRVYQIEMLNCYVS